MSHLAAVFSRIFGSEKTTVSAAKMTRSQYRRAVAELNRCSDAQLQDIGIIRGNISRVVLNGRDAENVRQAA